MENVHEKYKVFGLVGKNIAHSFSKKYFTEKFEKEHLDDCIYENFDLSSLDDFPEIIQKNPSIKGLNITIPYKEAILPYLDKLSRRAETIGAVNCIRVFPDGSLKGYNTDYFGFKKSLEPLLKPHHKKALILGTGGASKAIAFALKEKGILYHFVSRKQVPGTIPYEYVNSTSFDNYQIIINCTPLGTFPDTKECPDIPYEFFTSQHIAFDLIYNPAETEFLRRAKNKGAIVKNGQEMLEIQAEKGWALWNR